MAHTKHEGQGRLRRASLLWGLALFFCLVCATGTWAFVRTTINGVAVFWPDAQATLNLRLGCPATPLANWGPCWDDAAEDALGRWNAVAARFRLVKRTPSLGGDPCNADDGVNTVTFSRTFCGMTFPPDVLATTGVIDTHTGMLSDAVVVFNAALHWSTYPGPLQSAALDLHRVMMHEF